MGKPSRSSSWMRLLFVALSVGACAAIVGYAVTRKPPPESTEAISARLELAAGEVSLVRGDKRDRGVSGMALRVGTKVETSAGARALIRMPDGSSAFLRGDSAVILEPTAVVLDKGEYWLDVPPVERDALVHRIGKTSVTAAEAGLSIKRTGEGAVIYVASGMAVLSAEGGRVEVKAGEQATVKGGEAPAIAAVAFWDDWTGGMADRQGAGLSLGAGSGTIYGVDVGAPPGSEAQPLQIKQQAVRAILRDGLSETEVDQTFFNPGPRPVEGWYWFVIPPGASVTGFAVETDGNLVEGEVIERREAAAQYGRAKSSGHSPAILEWVDGKSYRARIFPVPATGTRRVVLRYIEMRPITDDKLTYVYPMGRGAATRIGEFSLSADLGDAGTKMRIATLDEARTEDNGRRVTMRRSGYTPRADFQLEATLTERRPPLTVARFETGGDSADYIMARYTPDVDWGKVAEPRADVVVVVDTSADGDESSRALQRTAAEAVLRALSPEDRFALVTLDVRAEVQHPKEGLAKAEGNEIAKALERLADHASGGATDMAALFDASLGLVHASEQPAVIYVGDGLATSGETSGEQLIERLRRAMGSSRARLFTVAVGTGADHPLLGELAHAGGGQGFRVDGATDATERALELVAAVKVPTITDLEIDLGAGLDEPFLSVNGKLPRGSDVLLLARTHHDLPKRATVRGRVGGESFEREVEVKSERGVVTAFVPRLWAAAYVQRLLGAAAGPDAERGRIVALGVEYGLVTPFTSILALESEQAYRRMNIPRNSSPLRGVRLGALDWRGERNVASIANGAPPRLAFGCALGDKAEEEPTAVASPSPMATAVAAAEPSPDEPADDAVATAKEELEAELDEDKPAEAPPAQAKVRSAVGDPLDTSDGAGPSGSEPAPRPLATGGRGNFSSFGTVGKGKDRGGLTGDEVGRIAPRPPPPPTELATCSDIAKRPLAQRILVWKKRIATAKSPADRLNRYQAARRACELEDWQAERAFLRVLQEGVDSEGGARLLLQSFSGRPDVQAYVAKLILRRAVDERLVAAVEGVVFGTAVRWDEVDRDLSELETIDARIARLQEVMARAPSDPNGQIRMVELLAQADRAEEALNLGRRLRDEGLMTPRIARQLGDVLARVGLEEEAVRTYSEIVEFDPQSLASRLLLGDIYLGHGWYEPAYRQYRTATEAEPNDAMAWLRLAAAAAGDGRTDEALRIERRVASAQGRPGPDDPRRWARLWSAARLARLIAEPPKGKAPSRESLERELKELGLFGAGPGTLVLLAWEDLASDVLVVSLAGEEAVAVGEIIDAAPVGLSALLLPPSELDRVTLVARLRSVPRADPLKLIRYDIAWDGKAFQVTMKRVSLGERATKVAL